MALTELLPFTKPPAPPVEVHGSVAPGFEHVREIFAENFAERGEVGAAFCVYRDGERIVDLWAGVADESTGAAWEPDTLANVFSSTKGLTAVALMMAVERGLLAFDDPVEKYWPEFAQAGKEGITVRTLFNHRSGLSALDAPLSIEELSDIDRVEAALLRQRPMWRPGIAQGYMAVTFGLYAAALFRRVTGTTIGRFLADEVAEPLGADIFLGLPDAEVDRVATIIPINRRKLVLKAVPELLRGTSVEARIVKGLLSRGSDTERALRNPEELGAKFVDNFNRADVRRLELPWANAHCSARGLARVYAALARGGTLDGTRLCSPDSVHAVERRQSWAYDRVLRKLLGFSQGFIKEEARLFCPNPEGFGHPGAGGCFGYADPTEKLGYAYVMNRMDHRLRSPRALALSHALYRCL